MEIAIKMSSIFELSSFSYSTPGRITFENMILSKKEKKGKMSWRLTLSPFLLPPFMFSTLQSMVKRLVLKHLAL